MLIVQLGERKSESHVTDAGELTRDPDNALPPVEVPIVQPGERKSESRVTGADGITPSPVAPYGRYGRATTGPPVVSTRVGRGYPGEAIMS